MAMASMEAINKYTRIRLYFEDSKLLNKTQKNYGLKRSWLLVKPHFHTIADVANDIIHGFDIHHHDIILTMDGFVLPPFESTIILKDNDLVRVKRKRLGVKAIIEAGPFIEDEIVEKRPLPSDVRLLTNEEFDKEAGGYESKIGVDEHEAKEPVQNEAKELVQRAGNDDVASKKRKSSSPFEISKKKRLRQLSPKSVQKKDTDHFENMKSLLKINNADGSKDEVTVKSTNNSEPRSESNELGEKKEVKDHASGGLDGARKVSRSTWRNKRKRHWKRVGRANNDEEGEKIHPIKDLDKVSGIKKNVDANIEQPADEDCDADDDLVPVEIRPGHIRFTSASKANDMPQGQETNGWDVKKNQENCSVQRIHEANGCDVQSTLKSADHSAEENVWDSNNIVEKVWCSVQKIHEANGSVQKIHEAYGCDVQSTLKSADHSAEENVCDSNNIVEKETFCWNGITSKKKGQKWGKESQPSRKESKDINGQSSDSRAISNHSTSSSKQATNHMAQSSNTLVSRQKCPNDSYMDFEKLMPLIDSPKVGDVVAYRLLELSSSWCPELSTFRVGKIMSYDQETKNIMLVPESEYPLNLEREEDCDHDADDYSGQPPQPSMYNEDGSLEIDFSSLVDVRIVESAIPSHSGGTGDPTANGTSDFSGMSKSTNKVVDGSKNGPLDTGDQELHTPINPANDEKDVWEEISKALSAKKTQLLQEDVLNKEESSNKRSWSRRTLKSSALGPTLAMLRSQNGV